MTRSMERTVQQPKKYHDIQDHGTRGNAYHWRNSTKEYDVKPETTARNAIEDEVAQWLDGLSPEDQAFYLDKSDSGFNDQVEDLVTYSTDVPDDKPETVSLPPSHLHQEAREEFGAMRRRSAQKYLARAATLDHELTKEDDTPDYIDGFKFTDRP